MASPGQQTMRSYSYGFNGKSGYTKLLNSAHKSIVSKMKLEANKEGAKTLEKFFQNVKDTARILMEQTSASKNIIHNEDVATRYAMLSGELANWYQDLVEKIVQTETNIRKKQGLSKLPGNKYNLFKRAHKAASVNSEQVDDIFEEEIAVLLAVLDKKLTGKRYTIDTFTTGKSMGQIVGSSAIEELNKDFTDGMVDGLKEVAKNQNMKISNQVLGKEFKKQVAIKTDIQNLSLDINATFGLENKDIDKIIPLLNDASFTAKNYLNTTIVKAGGLKLGETNLLRAIMGNLGIAFPENHANEWRDMFYRGAQIMIKTNTTPSASSEKVMQHFYHMRFAYELSGLGLIDSKTYKPLFTKYLIYNEPDSDKIHVFDTASLILEEFSSKSVANVFGSIHLHRNF